MDLSLVGRPDVRGEGVQCHTDLRTCCSGVEGPHRGDSYFPDGTRLRNPGVSVDTFQSRGGQRVEIRRNPNAISPVGIYRCDIPTNAVHSETDRSVRDTVYVGLYTVSRGMFSAKPCMIF